MTIRIMRDKTYEKGYRPNFYLVYKVRGKMKNRVMSDCPIRGTPPSSLSAFDRGDDTYERSRSKALAKAKELEKEQKARHNEAKILSDLIELKTGKAPTEVDVRISDLYNHWLSGPREGSPTDDRKKTVKKVFKELADFLKGKKLVVEVTKEDARRFYEWLKKTYAKGTVLSKMGIIRSEFADSLPATCKNPFERITKKKGGADESTIHRKLLSLAEADKVIAEAARHPEPMMYGITVAASETGMRIGDVCHLKWEDIDWKTKTIFCMTRKAHKKVAVPISDMLYDRLKDAEAIEGEPSPYIWPEAAAMYDTNKTGIYKRGTNLFAKALFGHLFDTPQPTVIEDCDKPMEPKTIYGAIDFIKESRFLEAKKQGIIKVLEAKAEGKTTMQIVRDLKMCKSMVCEYLREVVRTYGLDLRTQREPLNKMRAALEKTRIGRAVGQRSASAYGWHSFRGTFAFKAKEYWGMSLEDIRLLIGHSDEDTTLDNYLNPSRELTLEATRLRMNFLKMITDGNWKPATGVQPMPQMLAQQTKGLPPPAMSTLAIIKALSGDLQAKVATLPPADKAEFRKVTSVEDAKLFLSAY